MPRVAINIVTYNSGRTIDACLQAVVQQSYRDFSVLVVDNNSEDDTVKRVRAWEERGVKLVVNPTNEFFAKAHNWAIDHSDSDIVLALNPDVMLLRDYLDRVVAAFVQSARIGSVNGKLLLIRPDFSSDALVTPPDPLSLVDGAGITLRRSRRPDLRGNRQPHATACRQPAEIFGVDAACGAYLRRMLQDVAIDGEYFDTAFAMYREDVDLAWRAQLLGWDSWYAPDAVAYHIRGFHLGRGRRLIDPNLKRHSVKNGWLLMLKNDSPRSVLRDLAWILPYQVKILAGLLVLERSSLPAISQTVRLMPRTLAWRREIQRRRVRPELAMRKWIG